MVLRTYTYADPAGNPQTGYLGTDNHVYKDAEGKTPIDVGSTVAVANKDGTYTYYTKTADNNNPSYTLAAAQTAGANGGGANSNQYITDMYNQKIQAAEDALTSAYNRNVLAENAAKAQIPGTYNDARNATAATSAVNQHNFNEQAAANGLNSGTGSQAALAMNNSLQTNMGNLDKQQAKDTAAADLQLAQLAAKYQSDIAAAIADGKFQEAQALYKQYTKHLGASLQ